jgi:HPt (histidine-containing phosphotransfer) domain-containing protein
MEYFNYNKLIQEYGLNFLDANELINDFLNEIAELEAQVKNNFSNGHLYLLPPIAHKIKGTAGYFYCEKLEELANKLCYQKNEWVCLFKQILNSDPAQAFNKT